MNLMPVPGTFLRPLGGYGYTLEVVSIHPPQRTIGGLPQALCRRWGQKDGRPFDDGHVLYGHGVHLRKRGPGVWSSPSWYSDCPRRGTNLFVTVPGPSGQMGLFS